MRTRKLGLRGFALVGAALLLALASACSSSSNSAGMAAIAPAQGKGMAQAEQYGAGAAKDSAAAGQGSQTAGQAGDVPVQDRKLIRTARMELVAPDVVAAAARARDIAAVNGGFAGGEETRDDSASLTLQVPSDKLDQVVNQLAGLGRPTVREQKTQDVTDQVVDVEARLANQRASVERVRALLARASSVGEIVQIESELTRREADLESMQSRKDRLAGQVALSTITLLVTKDAPPPAPVPQDSTGFLSGLAAGWDAFLTMLSSLLAALGAILPFLATFGILAAVAYLLWRRRKPTPPTKQTPVEGPAPSI